MADEFDRASEREDKDREMLISMARAANQPIPASTHCLFCGAFTDGPRWCDSECRDGWERERNSQHRGTRNY